jgi:hypothetical protein
MGFGTVCRSYKNLYLAHFTYMIFESESKIASN